MIRRPPRSTHCISSAASDVYKRQVSTQSTWEGSGTDKKSFALREQAYREALNDPETKQRLQREVDERNKLIMASRMNSVSSPDGVERRASELPARKKQRLHPKTHENLYNKLVKTVLEIQSQDSDIQIAFVFMSHAYPGSYAHPHLQPFIEHPAIVACSSQLYYQNRMPDDVLKQFVAAPANDVLQRLLDMQQQCLQQMRKMDKAPADNVTGLPTSTSPSHSASFFPSASTSSSASSSLTSSFPPASLSSSSPAASPSAPLHVHHLPIVSPHAQSPTATAAAAFSLVSSLLGNAASIQVVLPPHLSPPTNNSNNNNNNSSNNSSINSNSHTSDSNNSNNSNNMQTPSPASSSLAGALAAASGRPAVPLSVSDPISAASLGISSMIPFLTGAGALPLPLSCTTTHPVPHMPHSRASYSPIPCTLR
eukprot:TRINITY_DN1970_c0_g1_i2.p1 TRINITY_DN1970_c0_g1~~TRINITY_DN1970_c0_g1_i2.p1  ORF type:complete len:425 (+),score=16.89 TRINITY_DN1970_c0_g1_i2:121-1395(+)